MCKQLLDTQFSIAKNSFSRLEQKLFAVEKQEREVESFWKISFITLSTLFCFFTLKTHFLVILPQVQQSQPKQLLVATGKAIRKETSHPQVHFYALHQKRQTSSQPKNKKY